MGDEANAGSVGTLFYGQTTLVLIQIENPFVANIGRAYETHTQARARSHKPTTARRPLPVFFLQILSFYLRAFHFCEEMQHLEDNI